MKNDPLKETKNKIDRFIDKLHKYKFISMEEKRMLTENCPVHPRMFGLIKLHKPDKNLRPIVNGRVLGTNCLKPSLDFLNNDNKFDVKNSMEAKSKISNIKLDKDYIHCSFNVASLFTN